MADGGGAPPDSSGSAPALPPVGGMSLDLDEDVTRIILDLDDYDLEKLIDMLYPLIRERLTAELRHDAYRGRGATFWT